MKPGCYLCRPDDPNAAEEACDDCDREFWKNPVGIVLDEEDPKPIHQWAGDDEGHNCVECGPDSIWKCDRLAHFDPQQMIDEVNREIGPDLERMARQRRLAGPDGRQLG